ncbi:hypothetical protein C2G38_2244607 [Gigaspora rosea]|uniref:Poly [ADP-ribose] polymerase n=1 Tax=Gigaspora rosea TaxID=44941 RepID=A0A397VEW2_9GLOM|nr:hypothetical protein C2G38_2244607 [Gigaspora rosea]
MTCLHSNCQNAIIDDDLYLCDLHHKAWKLPKTHPEFIKTKDKFLNDWTKQNAQDVRIEELYHIILSPAIVEKYKQYKFQIEKNRGANNERILYHGTDHSCTIISSNSNMLCKTDDCAGCGIIMNSFDINKVGVNRQNRSFQRLGQGLYFTPHSSKAHFYGHGGAKPLPVDPSRTCRIMFMTKVVLGNMWQPDQVAQNARSPPDGYDSTWGRVGHCPHGGATLNYEEYAVYNHEACLPTKYIVYSYTSTSE